MRKVVYKEVMGDEPDYILHEVIEQECNDEGVIIPPNTLTKSYNMELIDAINLDHYYSSKISMGEHIFTIHYPQRYNIDYLVDLIAYRFRTFEVYLCDQLTYIVTLTESQIETLIKNNVTIQFDWAFNDVGYTTKVVRTLCLRDYNTQVVKNNL